MATIGLLTVTLLSCWIAEVASQVPHVSVSYSTAGLEFRVPDQTYRQVIFHYNINSPLPGVTASQHSADVNTKTGSDFVLLDSSTHLQPGDKVNYWTVGITQSGDGYQITDQSWTYVGATTAKPTTTTTTTTTATTTTAQPAVSAQHTTHPHVTHTAATVSGGGSGTGTATGSSGSGTGTGTNTGSNLDGFTDFGGANQFGGGSSSGGGSGHCDCYGPGKGDGYVDDRACTTFPCLIFEDNFDFINFKVWEHEITAGGGGNWEFQYYTNNRTNSYTKNGVLYIKPTLTYDHYGPLDKVNLEIWGSSPADVCTGNQFWGCKREGQPGQIVNPIQSARLRSSRGFNFRYGKVEVEAKLPKGDWLWPAIWMLPRYNVYGAWPASGEIDIMESRGNANYRNPQGTSIGVDSFGSTLHFGADFFTNKWPTAHKEFLAQSGTFADDFHKYGVEWTNTSIIFTLDGQEMYKIEPGAGGFWEYGGLTQDKAYNNPWLGGSHMAPFDQEYYIILNVAVGGVGFFADANTNSPNPKPWVDGAGHEADRFWQQRSLWYPTWHPDVNNGEDAALKVNYVKVWKSHPDP